MSGVIHSLLRPANRGVTVLGAWWRIGKTVGRHSGRCSQFLLATCATVVCLFLASPMSAEVTVVQTWDQEYQELTGQIDRRTKSEPAWRDRLKAEALDPQALSLRSDRDPLDVVLRRTAALIQWHQRRSTLPSSVLEEVETTHNKRSTAVRAVA